MFSLAKTLIKTTLIGTTVIGVTAGAALLTAGPKRVGAVIDQTVESVKHAIDERIDDPVALRSRLRELEAQYPERIASLRADHAELKSQILQLERERAISRRVVELADEDLAMLRPALGEASAQAVSLSGASDDHLTAVMVENRVWSARRAQAKVRQVENTRNAHATRAADAEHSLVYLRQQSGRFEEAIAQLESEQAEFRVQLDQLNRQVDSIQRNQRLIEMLAERKRTLEECESYDCASLDQVTGKLGLILDRQAAELDVLSSTADAFDYEDLAREELGRERELAAPNHSR